MEGWDSLAETCDAILTCCVLKSDLEKEVWEWWKVE